MNYIDVLNRAFSCLEYVYWYGGKGQKCTQQLLNTLAKQNPGTYSTTYINKAKKDITNGKTCIDCSGLVCKAYNISNIGSYQIHDTFKKINTKDASAGMVLWKPGHVALVVDDDYIIEAKGIDYDVLVSKRVNNNFNTGLYLEGVSYNKEYSKGWHTDEVGKWYAWGEHKGCYFRNCYTIIDGKGYYFDDGGYLIG